VDESVSNLRCVSPLRGAAREHAEGAVVPERRPALELARDRVLCRRADTILFVS